MSNTRFRNLKILFFSRGRGRGHAIPDIQLIEDLTTFRHDLAISFVSYGSGARTLIDHGVSVIDLGLPEMNVVVSDITTAAGPVIRLFDPDIVISHEEFAALPVAKGFHKRTVFITDWFVDETTYWMQSLRWADGILFLDRSGIYEEPKWVRGRVNYVGPILRNFQYSRKDRARARRELGIPLDSTVLSVLPGSWTEKAAPIHELVIDAFGRLAAVEKRLVWVADSDYRWMAERYSGRNDILIKEIDWQIDRLIVASDLCITKANRGTAFELDALGVPSISISWGLNPIDDQRVSKLPLNHILRAQDATSETLAAAIERLLESPPKPRDVVHTVRSRPAEVLAALLP